jgi:hypothetical protein
MNMHKAGPEFWPKAYALERRAGGDEWPGTVWVLVVVSWHAG